MCLSIARQASVSPQRSKTEACSFIAGVDEAGYGPKLGPLVVTFSAFRSSSGSVETDLEGAAGRIVSIDDPRVAVDDSKKVYRGRRGFGQLEKTALAFWSAARGEHPETLGELLDGSGCNDPGLASCPWYGPDPAGLRLPLAVTPKLVARSSRLIARTLERAGASFLGFRCQVAPAPRFNNGVARWKNKAAFLAELALGTIQHALSSEVGRPARIVVDKLGGRNHYAHLLSNRFGQEEVMIEEERRARSFYRIGSGAERIEIGFERSADQRHLPVALSSMFCKYVREVFMTLFNRFWTSIEPGLRPTAGYPTDARRFLDDVGLIASRSGIALEDLVRIR